MSASLRSDNHGLVRPWERGNTFQLERIAPSPTLERVIERHWVVRWDLRGREPFRQEVMPHPSINLVVESSQSRTWGVPTRRDSRLLEATGWAVGTKFQPGAFTACTRIDASRLTDSHLSVPAAFGRSLDQHSHEPQSIIAAVENLLVRYAAIHDPALDLVAQVIGSMRRLPPNARVEDIADINHIAPRTLQRLFRRYVGVSPKWVLKRLRIHQAVEQISSHPPTEGWTELALELGYYDHAHFIRDFRLIVGRSPTQYGEEAELFRKDRRHARPKQWPPEHRTLD
jgi:AraC-like DNA-binding protein